MMMKYRNIDKDFELLCGKMQRHGDRYLYHCPKCDADSMQAQPLDEYGGMERTVITRCECGTKYRYYG